VHEYREGDPRLFINSHGLASPSIEKQPYPDLRIGALQPSRVYEAPCFMAAFRVMGPFLAQKNKLS